MSVFVFKFHFHLLPHVCVWFQQVMKNVFEFVRIWKPTSPHPSPLPSDGSMWRKRSKKFLVMGKRGCLFLSKYYQLEQTDRILCERGNIEKENSQLKQFVYWVATKNHTVTFYRTLDYRKTTWHVVINNSRSTLKQTLTNKFAHIYRALQRK